MSMKFASLISILCLAPTLALADPPRNVTTTILFGKDPGTQEAHACFKRHFDAAWLKSHPDQNIADLIVYAGRTAGEGTWLQGNMQISFRDTKNVYQVSASCGDAHGNVISCGVDCDGGGFDIKVAEKNGVAITPDSYLRYYDPDDNSEGMQTAGFKPGDKDLTVTRTDIKDCLPLIYVEEVKARLTVRTPSQ